MSLYQFQLRAGIPLQANISGKVILIDSTGEAESIDIIPMRGGQEDRPLTKRQKAFKCWVDFDTVVLKAEVDCTVLLFLSRTDVSLGFADGANVNVRGAVSLDNDLSNPVPVTLQGGNINVTATNVGINNTNAAALPVKNQALSNIVDLPSLTIPGTAAVALVNDPTLRRLRVRNSHESAVIAIGGAGVTLANSPIRLLPGDAFIESDAAGAPWFVISDTPGATVQLQGIK